MKVVVLERGERWGANDFEQSDDPRYIQKVMDIVVARSTVAFRTGKLVGGASINMDGGHFRMPSKAFDAKEASGRRYWPSAYSRATLDPYYAKVEAMLKVRQFAWTEIPKAGGLFAKMLDAAGCSCERSRMNYTDCIHCGFCSQGCKFDKKQSLILNYIPLAESKGAEFRAKSTVDHFEPDGTGYVVRYQKDGVAKEIWAQRLFVGGGGIHTPALLLRSKPWLPALSTHVGEHFNNNGEHAFVGVLPPEFDDLSSYQAFMGMDNAGMMSFHFWDSEGFSLHPGGGLEPSVFAASFADPSGMDEVLPKRSWGLEYKRFVEKVYPHRIIAFSTLGLADGHRAVVLGDGGAPDIVDRNRTTYDAYLDRVERNVFAVGQKSGIKLVPTTPRRLAGTTSAHLLTSCRMAESVADGVVDPEGHVFGYDNLYVCDASAIPYAMGVNPALSISAVAERVVEKAIAKG